MADIPLSAMQENNIYRIALQVKVNGNSFLDKFSINYQQTLDYLSNPKIMLEQPLRLRQLLHVLYIF